MAGDTFPDRYEREESPQSVDHDDTERCMDCGADYPRWWAATPLFLEVIGGHGGPSLLCVGCFTKRAAGKGIELLWVPRRWDDEARAFVEADTKAAMAAWQQQHCTFDHPHPGQPCGRRVIDGVTRCSVCGNFDGSPECAAAGCWEPFTEADLDSLYAEAWGLDHG